ncbi:polysaccharide biosynthesis/export family protein [Thalassobellus citreus]|uniref:polysaccharide biosynthesis/export family protein n=1 Tax=Thalassobellus citreus TaxID=3367752 RepID=UPI0037A621C3
MNKMFSKFILKYKLICIICLYFLTSCANRKDVVYFQNTKNFETIVDTDTFQPKFKINDNVSIFISTFDLESAKPFNLDLQGSQVGTTGGNISQVGATGYIIDVDGNIDYPVLGKIKLLGLTLEEGKALLKEKLAQYLKDPIVNIRILNFQITILGAVNRPGTYPVTGERISLLKALGLAGDLNIKGRRDNVLVIRDFNGVKTSTRIDLTNKELFNSPVYFLTQNDVVYVEQNKSGVSGASGDNRLGTIISISSFALGIALLITRI